MKIIVGLGNPGKQYDHTRHNLGFMAVDACAASLGASAWRKHHKADALTSEVVINGEKCLLAKPQTFMNNSGAAVRDLASFYKVNPSDIIVVHDDLDLPFGDMRISIDASAGGHNGVASIIEDLGTQHFTRLRLGIRGQQKSKVPSEKFVLLPFSLLERLKKKGAISRALEALECLASRDVQSCMNAFN